MLMDSLNNKVDSTLEDLTSDDFNRLEEMDDSMNSDDSINSSGSDTSSISDTELGISFASFKIKLDISIFPHSFFRIDTKIL